MQFKNKKGDVSETMTWIFATIIILVLVGVFLFAVSFLGKTKSLTGFNSYSYDESGIANKEMLLAILSKKIDGKSILEKINEGNYESVSSNVKGILDEFSKEGVVCNFYIYEKGSIISLMSVNNGAKGKEVSININGKEVYLRC
jgi:hypothetical protein